LINKKKSTFEVIAVLPVVIQKEVRAMSLHSQNSQAPKAPLANAGEYAPRSVVFPTTEGS
jgi:hypothetical protein